MFTFEYKFYPQKYDDKSIDDFDDSFRWFLIGLERNGQILQYGQNTVQYETYYTCRVIAPEKDSLDSKYYNKYCTEFLAKLTDKSSEPPEYQLIGENYDVMDSCECDDPSHYILYTTNCSDETPVYCGDCTNPVPLYKLPKTCCDNEYHDILIWQNLYKACYEQFMNGVGERHGYKMIHSTKSELSIEGLRICRYLEEKMNKKFFYYLFDYYSTNKTTCPNCGENWVNQVFDRFNYDYICHECSLVSK